MAFCDHGFISEKSRGHLRICNQAPYGHDRVIFLTPEFACSIVLQQFISISSLKREALHIIPLCMKHINGSYRSTHRMCYHNVAKWLRSTHACFDHCPINLMLLLHHCMFELPTYLFLEIATQASATLKRNVEPWWARIYSRHHQQVQQVDAREIHISQPRSPKKDTQLSHSLSTVIWYDSYPMHSSQGAVPQPLENLSPTR